MTTATAQSATRMTSLTYTVRFLTPAFLGNAEQQGQWRTPPFKALLRQWWRVAAAKKIDYKHDELRKTEGQLFGNAWLEPVNGKSQFCKSHVLLRLDSWGMGGLSSNTWPGGSIEDVVTTRDGRGRVRADVYMGYGPVLPPNRRDNRPITIRNAIGPTEPTIRLRIGYKRDLENDVMEALQLIQWFGTLGSRSRNSWGSLLLEPIENASALSILPQIDHPLISQIGRSWRECLKEEWPHALGTEAGKPLIWITEPKLDWRTVMGCLANIKVEVRQSAKTIQGPSGIGGIHLLGYPAGGKWEIRKLGKEARLASQLRFKVVRDTQDRARGMVFHLPCRFPDKLSSLLEREQKAWIEENEQKIWENIHRQLNTSRRLKPLFD